MELSASIDQCWPPFVLVTGLLLVGLVAESDGVFRWAGGSLERLPGPPRALLAACLAAVAVTTAILNLDTAVVFMTPVLIHAARRRGVDEMPFLYGAVFMANASSLFLPGSNLTNLLVLSSEPTTGGEFASRILPAALAASLITAAGLLLIRPREAQAERVARPAHAKLPLTVGSLAIPVVAVLVLVLPQPAIPVLAVGLAVGLLRIIAGPLTLSQARRMVGPVGLTSLFVLATAFSVLGRAWSAPAELLADASAAGTAVVGAVSAVLFNNLPAAALFGAGTPAHPSALLIGLNIGPNLAVTGSLSALLWMRSARQAGAKPSAVMFSRFGILLAPPAICAALLLL